MRRLVLGGAASLCVAVGCLVVVAGCAVWGLVVHAFLPAPSKRISEGVPLAFGALLTGRLSGVNSLTVDERHLWIAEKIAGHEEFRVDRWSDSSGVWEAPQFNQTSTVTGSEHGGVAVGHATGEAELYLGALELEGGGKERPVVAVFNAAGVLQHAWTGAHTPNKAFTPESGSENEVSGVAVDESSSVGTHGDVYVAARSSEAAFDVVDVFRPVAGGGEPSKEPAKVLKGTCAVLGTSCAGKEIPFKSPSGVAVSTATGDVYVVDAHKVVDVFAPTALGEYVFVRQLTGTPTGVFNNVIAVAVDGGEVYVADQGAGVVDEFNGEGQYVGRLTGTPAGAYGQLSSVAVDPVSHEVFVGDFNPEKVRGFIDVYAAGAIVPDVETKGASEVGVAGARLNGLVNPDGAGAASCQFVFGETEALGQVAKCPGEVANGKASVAVSAMLAGLQPDTQYFYRLQASNANGTDFGEETPAECEGKPSVDACFTTGGPGVHEAWAFNVASDSATLNAVVVPHGKPTSFFFEYGLTAGYGRMVPEPAGSVGSGEAGVPVEHHLQGLAVGTTYHFRVVAVSEGVAFPGADHTFTTSGAGGGPLPDARQWELVSPPDKHSAQILAIGEGELTQGAVGGNAFSFVTNAPTEREPAGYSGGVQVLSTRGPAGWTSKDIATPHETVTGLTAEGLEYRFFSEDLSQGVVQPTGAFTALSGDASEQTAYVRSNFPPASPTSLCGEGCYRPLVTGCPPPGSECRTAVREHANVPAGTAFGQEGVCPEHAQSCGPQFVGATGDLKHVVLRSVVPLTPGAGERSLYEWSAGSLALISVLPEGGSPGTTPFLGLANNVVRNAVSSDGSRIVWSEGGGHLFMRDVVRGETVQLDKPLVGSSEKGGAQPQFQMASSDGSRVFFTDQQRLTEDAGESLPPGVQQGDLYECVMRVEAGKLRCELKDLTPEGESGRPVRVLDVVPGASEDGSWVYFVADGALAPGAVNGTCTGNPGGGSGDSCNLYVWHEGVVRLVAVLSQEDYPDWNGQGTALLLARVTSRVSPDGRWVAFMSQRSLTGYDTRDARTGKPDEEVYLYHAEPAGAGRLVCVSCDPAGARPVGIEYQNLTIEGGDGIQIWNLEQGLGGHVPAWTSWGHPQAEHQSRYLADNGRVFFNSPSALVPGDVNGVGDVYEFEPVGVGGCSSGTFSGRVVFVASAGGCVGLVSSGTGPEEATFMDASATGGPVVEEGQVREGGGDVFFLTADRLAPQDFDTSLDVYDAHECTSIAPCFPAAVVPPPACSTGDSCKAAPTPQPGIFGAPASATFSGAGNPTPPPSSRSEAQIRAEKLAKALKACRAKHNRRQRARCEHEAHRRYGASTSSRKASTRKPRIKRKGRR